MAELKKESIDRFLNRVRQASNARSKDVRLSIEEASELAAVIGQLLLRHVPAKDEPDSLDVKMDGGGFQ